MHLYIVSFFPKFLKSIWFITLLIHKDIFANEKMIICKMALAFFVVDCPTVKKIKVDTLLVKILLKTWLKIENGNVIQIIFDIKSKQYSQ